MANVSIEGLENVVKQLDSMVRGVDEAEDEILTTVGKLGVSTWREAMTASTSSTTGELRKSIRASKKKKQHAVDIAPSGYRKKKDGTRGGSYAAAVFSWNYGTSKWPGSHFLKRAEEKISREVGDVCEKILDKYIK